MANNWDQYVAQPEPQQSMDWEQFRAPAEPMEDQRPHNLDPSFAKRIPGAAAQVGSDVWSGVKHLPLKAIVGLLKAPSKGISIAKGIPDVGRQIINEPGRAASNVIAGLAEIGHGALNTPRAIADYANKIGLIEPETAEKIPQQHDITPELRQLVEVGGGPKPGDYGIREAVHALPEVLPAGKLALSPYKLTTRSLKNNILATEKAMKEKYSGPNGLYTRHFDQARARGLGNVSIAPSSVDLKAISKNTPAKFTESTENFLKSPTLENAQKSVSDLGFLERTLQKRFISNGLTSEESKALKAATKAKEHIKRQMFTDQSGNFHPDLHAAHEAIQKGYASEVIPYTKNPHIQNFKNNKLTKEGLIKRLSGDVGFYPQRGHAHKALGLRKAAEKYLGTKLGQGAVLGAGAASSMAIIHDLLGNND